MKVDRELRTWFTRELPTVASIRLVDDDGSTLLTPTSSTYTLYSPGGTVLVDAAAATVPGAGGTSASYSVTLASTADLGPGYTEIWAVTIASVVYPFRFSADACLTPFRSTLTEQHLTDWYPTLADVMQTASVPTFERVLRSAWVAVAKDIQKSKRYPYLVMSPEDFNFAERHRALALIFQAAGMASRKADSGYKEAAADHMTQYRAELESLGFDYDADKSGLVSTDTTESHVYWSLPGVATGSASSRWSR